MKQFWRAVVLLVLYKSMLALCQGNLTGSVECYVPPILAPEYDCREVLMEMLRQYGQPGLERDLIWGRSIAKTNDTHVHLPWGYQLRHWPTPEQSMKCEIHVDNRFDGWDKTDRFKVMDVIFAGFDVLNECYPTFNTGKGDPSGRRLVYVTTIRVPPLQEPQANVTILDSTVASNMSSNDTMNSGMGGSGFGRPGIVVQPPTFATTNTSTSHDSESP